MRQVDYLFFKLLLLKNGLSSIYVAGDLGTITHIVVIELQFHSFDLASIFLLFLANFLLISDHFWPSDICFFWRHFEPSLKR